MRFGAVVREVCRFSTPYLYISVGAHGRPWELEDNEPLRRFMAFHGPEITLGYGQDNCGHRNREPPG